MKRILHISPDFNYSCGVSKLVYLTLLYFNDRRGYESHFITNGGDSLERLNDLQNITIQLFNFSRGMRNIFFYKEFYKNLNTYCCKVGIDVIHTYHRFPEYVAVKVSEGKDIKTVGTILSFVKGFKKVSFKSNRLITVSNVIKNNIVEDFNIDSNRITSMYLPKENFYEPRNGYLKSSLGIKADIKVLLYMGRMNFIKNVDNLLKAYEVVHKQIPDTLLVLCGNLESKKIKGSLKSIKAPIKVLEPMRDNYLLYPLADLVILPSRVDPFPFVMIEAGAFKKPFIGGNTGGIAEFIEDGINGLLVDPENPQDLAEKIIYLLNNPQIGRTMGEKLYEKVNRLCDYNNYFSEVEKIYNSLITE